MKQPQWSIQRRTVAHRDGERRLDQAYQLLVLVVLLGFLALSGSVILKIAHHHLAKSGKVERERQNLLCSERRVERHAPK